MGYRKAKIVLEDHKGKYKLKKGIKKMKKSETIHRLNSEIQV